MLEEKNKKIESSTDTKLDSISTVNTISSDNSLKLEADTLLNPINENENVDEELEIFDDTIDDNTFTNDTENSHITNKWYSKREKSSFVLKGKDMTHELYYGENKIGRLPSNDIVIEDYYVSRFHATITVHKDKVEVKDHSLNGTYINLERLRPSKVETLTSNSEIQIWLFSYVLEQRVEDKDSYRIQIEKIGDEIAYVQSNHTRRLNAGFSLIELLIVIAIIGIIAAISIPNLLSSRRAANSASAVQTMRLIATSQASYQAGAGNGQYATIDNLVREQYIDSSVGAASLPSSSTTQAPKSGYVFFFNTVASDPSTNTLPSYSVSARPLVNGSNGLIISGNKSFYVDNSGVIKVSPSPLAPYADVNSTALN